MKIAVPIFHNGIIYNQVEIEKPKTKVLSLAQEILQRYGAYRAIMELIVGCVERYIDLDGNIVDNKAEIRTITGLMPYMSAEDVSLKIITELNEDDTIEGIYTCPRCGENFITEYDSRTKIDTRDKVSELEVIFMPEDNLTRKIKLELKIPVKIVDLSTKEIMIEIIDIEMHYPTLNDCIEGSKGKKNSGSIEITNQIYLSALEKVNGEEIDKKWKVNYGKILFDDIRATDLIRLGKTMMKYGIKKSVLRRCINCQKEWEAPINTSNFFESGLHQV